MNYPNTTLVMLNKSKLTNKELETIKNHPKGIDIQENKINIMIYDLEYLNPTFMVKMVNLLYKTIRR